MKLINMPVIPNVNALPDKPFKIKDKMQMTRWGYDMPVLKELGFAGEAGVVVPETEIEMKAEDEKDKELITVGLEKLNIFDITIGGLTLALISLGIYGTGSFITRRIKYKKGDQLGQKPTFFKSYENMKPSRLMLAIIAGYFISERIPYVKRL